MIEFSHVSASYGNGAPVLHDVSFSIGQGEFVAFVGTNGAGKSTTMRLFNGLLKPSDGQVLIDGVSIVSLKTSELARNVGYLFQNPDSQICCSTVRDELMFGFVAQGRADDEAAARVDAVIEEFGFDPAADPFLLNRGTRQLLALASIVVMEPPVIILDEPTTGLDYRECMKVMGIVRGLHDKGTTVVMVCHDMEVVADFAQRVIVMDSGRVIDDGPTFAVLRNRRTLQAASLVAPQMVTLSMALAQENPALGRTPLGSANTLDEMTAAVLEVRAGRDGRSFR